jgi:hypothetical protein
LPWPQAATNPHHAPSCQEIFMPFLRVRPVAASEATTTFSFVVSLDTAATSEVRVSYALVNGTAFFGTTLPDFTAASGTLVFAPGEIGKTITTSIINDTVFEPTEVFWIELTTPINASVEQRFTPVPLFDNDAVAGTPVLNISDPVVDETASSVSFWVWLSQPSTKTTSVKWDTANQTATAGSDYTAGAGVLSFAPGETLRSVTVPILNDISGEDREVFRVLLSEPNGVTLARPFGEAEIGANDGPTSGTRYISARPTAAGEGEPLLNYVISLSSAAATEVRVSFNILKGNAITTGGAPDFATYSGTLVFSPGETTKTLPVILYDDGGAERTEVVWLDLVAPFNATVKQRYTPGLVFDNDGPPTTPAIQVTAPIVDETAGTASFFVMLSRASTSVVTVDYQTADDTTTAGEDYRAVSGNLSFQPGEVVKTVTIDLVNDTLAEGTEFFQLLLSNASGATVAAADVRAEIGASDAPTNSTPHIHARPAAAGELDGHMAFVIELSAPSTQEVRVNYDFANGTAVFDGTAPDFATYKGTLVFIPGQTTQTLLVPVVDNNTAEATELFWLDLHTPVNGVVTQRYTPGHIYDNDASAATPAVSVGDVVINESTQVAMFTVSLSGPSTEPVTVDYTTADDTAAAGSDYRAAAGQLTFMPGETAKTVRVDVHNDGLAESDEFFQLLLSSPVQATLADAVGTARLARSDGATVSQPLIEASSVVASEGDGELSFIVQLSAPSVSEVKVDFAFGDASARAVGSTPDYAAYTGTLVFAPGETSRQVTVQLINDTAAEADEAFLLELSNPVNATVSDRVATATVIDDDGTAAVHSHGLGNDTYTVVSALDRIAEGPGGGIDTVHAAVDFTLPDEVENLLLTGSATNAVGNAGNNVLRGTVGNNRLDGQGGIDTAVFGGASEGYTITVEGDTQTVSGGADGTDTLVSIERLQFSDRVMASDTTVGGHTWLAYAMLNAAFDAPPDAATLSRWTAQLDRLGDADALAQAMINAFAPGVSNEVLVEHLWSTIIGTPIPDDQRSAYIGRLQDGTYTQASLVVFATGVEENTSEIVDIVGQTLSLDPAFFVVPGV